MNSFFQSTPQVLSIKTLSSFKKILSNFFQTIPQVKGSRQNFLLHCTFTIGYIAVFQKAVLSLRTFCSLKYLKISSQHDTTTDFLTLRLFFEAITQKRIANVYICTSVLPNGTKAFEILIGMQQSFSQFSFKTNVKKTRENTMIIFSLIFGEKRLETLKD